MPIAECPSCRSKLRVPGGAAGKAVRCPKCAKSFRVSGPAVQKTPAAERPMPPPPKMDLSEESVLGEGDLDVVEELDEIEDDGEQEWAAERPRNRRSVKNVVGRGMRIERDVPESLRRRISEELSEDERLIWFGQPNVILTAIRGLGGTAVGLLMFLSLAGYLIGVAAGVLKAGEGWRGWPLLFLMEAPFYLVSVGIMLVPVWWGWQATRTCYALTNRRAVVWSCTWFGALRVHSSSPGDLKGMRRADSWIYGRGAGDLIFHGAGFSPQTIPHGFLAIDDVRDVEELIHDTLIDL